MYYVIEDRVYSSVFDTENNRYPLVSVAKSAGGVITVTDEGDGISTLPSVYKRCTIEEVVAIFGVTSTNEYEPRATITGNDPVLIYLDEANKAVTLTIANPALGDFSDVASSKTAVATVAEANSVFTITPVAEGTCNITATWTPTDTGFAASTVTIPVTVAKRQIQITQVRDQSLTVSTTKDITLGCNIASPTYVVTSSDTGICDVSETSGVITLTPPETAPKGSAIIKVSATGTNAYDSEIMSFTVKVCASAVTITAIADQTIASGASKEISVTCAGATIKEVTTSDATHVTTEITDNLKFKIYAVGDAEDTATVTVYCDKRGYGEDSEELTVTIT